MNRLAAIAVVVAFAASLVGSSALAGNARSNSNSSISLVLLSSRVTTESANPRFGDQVTFAVSTTATDRPYVVLNCYQGGAWVYTAQAGFYAVNPFGTTFTLASGWWTGGQADCTATLGMNSAGGTKFTRLASTSFHVDA